LEAESKTMTQTVGIEVETSQAKRATDEFRSACAAMRAEFQAAEQGAQRLADAISGIKSTGIDAVADSMKRLSELARGAAEDVRRLSGELDQAARDASVKLQVTGQEKLPPMLQDLRNIAGVVDADTEAMKRLAGETAHAAAEGARLREEYARIAAQRTALLSGSGPSQPRLSGPTNTASTVIDITPLNAAQVAFQRLKDIATGAWQSIQSGASLIGPALSAVASYARGAASGLAGMASSAGAVALQVLGVTARAVGTGLYYAVTGTVAVGSALLSMGAAGVRAISSIVSGVGSMINSISSIAAAIMGVLGPIAKGIAGLFGGAGLGFSFLAHSAIETADSFTLFERRLVGLSDGSTKSVNDLRAAVLGVANDTRSSIDDSSKSFNKFYQILAPLGASADDVRALVTGAGAAMKLSGTSAVEAERAMVQLAQAFAKGKFDLQDLKSIAQSSPGLMRVITDAAGMSMARLNEKLKEGGPIAKNLMSTIASAITNTSEVVAQKLALMPRTMAEAITGLKNQWFLVVGEMQNNSDFMSPLISSIDRVKALIAGDAFKKFFGDTLALVTQTAEQLIRWAVEGETIGTKFARVSDHFRNIGGYIKAALYDLKEMAKAKTSFGFFGDANSDAVGELRNKINAERDAKLASDRNSPFTGAITGDKLAVDIARARDGLDDLRKAASEMPKAELRLHFNSAEAATQKAALIAAAESAAKDVAIGMQRQADITGTGLEQLYTGPINRVVESYSVLREQTQKNEVSPAAITGFTGAINELSTSIENSKAQLIEFQRRKDEALGRGDTAGVTQASASIDGINAATLNAIPALERAVALKRELEGGGLSVVVPAATGTRKLVTPDAVEKKGGAGRSDESAQQKLRVLQQEEVLLRSQITGNTELARIEAVELEVTKAVASAIKSGNVELVASIANQVRLNDELKRMKETYDTLKGLGHDIGTSISDNFMKMGEGAQTFKQALKNILAEMVKMAAQALIIKPLINSFSNSFAGALTPAFGTSLSKDGGGLLGGSRRRSMASAQRYRSQPVAGQPLSLEAAAAFKQPLQAAAIRLPAPRPLLEQLQRQQAWWLEQTTAPLLRSLAAH
jgi:tape measure domain-containing protein